MPLSIVSFLPRIASRDSQLGVSSETKDAANPSAKQGGLSAAKSSPRPNWILDLLKGGQHQGQGEQLLRYRLISLNWFKIENFLQKRLIKTPKIFQKSETLEKIAKLRPCA